MSSAMGPPRFAEIATVLLVVVMAAALRLAPAVTARTGAGWVLSDGDSYYHLRRIEQTIERRGRVPMFDPDLSFPDGQRIQWHGGYDLLISGLVVACCGLEPTRDCITPVALASTPLLGLMAVVGVLLLGRSVLGRWPGILAAALFAAYPFSAGSAAFGHVDHHVLEPLLVTLMVIALCRGRGALGGVAAGVAFTVFPTALLAVGAIGVALFVEALVRLWRGARLSADGVGFSLVTLVAVVPVVWSGGFSDGWTPASTSRFHLVAIAAMGLCLAAPWAASRLVAGRGRRLLASAAVVLVVLGVAAVLAAPHLADLALFGRAAGLWTGVVQQAPFGATPSSQVVLLLVVVGAAVISARAASRQQNRTMALIAGAALPLTVAGLMQIRFLMMASPLLVLVVAHLLFVAATRLGPQLAGAPRRARVLARLVLVSLCGLALVPTYEYWVARPPRGPNPLTDGIQLLRRLGRRVDPADPRAAVLSNWIWGHHILYFAGLPTVASPFMLGGKEDRANWEALRALLATRPEPLYRLMERRRARYLLITGLFDPRLARASLGRPEVGSTGPPPAAVALMQPAPAGWSRLRLIDAQGNARLYELMSDFGGR